MLWDMILQFWSIPPSLNDSFPTLSLKVWPNDQSESLSKKCRIGHAACDNIFTAYSKTEVILFDLFKIIYFINTGH